VNSGKHTPNHVAILRKARKFITDNKSHPLGKHRPLHQAIAKARIPLHAGVITTDNLNSLIEQSVIGTGKFGTRLMPAHVPLTPASLAVQRKIRATGRPGGMSEAVDFLIKEGWMRSVASYNVGQHHSRPGKLASHIRPFGRKKTPSKPLGLHNPATFYPKGNPMSPTGSDPRKHHSEILAAAGAIAASAGGAYLFKKRQQAKKKKKPVHEAADKILKARERRSKLNALSRGDVALEHPDFKSLVHAAIKKKAKGETRLIKRHTRAAARDKKRGFATVPKPHGLSGRLSGTGLAKDHKGYFVHTHRARCSSYPTPEKIPLSKIKFIRSTG